MGIVMPDPLPRPQPEGTFVSDEQWDAIDNGNEILLWFLIESLGGFIWRQKHDLADGRITDSVSNVNQGIALAQTVIEHLSLRASLHGVEFDEPEGDALPRPQWDAYWKWYKWWKSYVDSLSGDQWAKITSDESLAQCRPDGDWRDDT